MPPVGKSMYCVLSYILLQVGALEFQRPVCLHFLVDGPLSLYPLLQE